jgi:uncharacterized protein with FMN-binding domain
VNRKIPVLATAVAAAVGPATTVADVAVAASSKTYYGPTVSMKYGPVAVAIRISGRRIVAISSTYPTERARSAQINGRAIPTLRSEALRAQSARIHSVSGATLTSTAFARSLQSALTKAHL